MGVRVYAVRVEWRQRVRGLAGSRYDAGLLVTISFSGFDRMDNVLKDHRWPNCVAGYAV